LSFELRFDRFPEESLFRVQEKLKVLREDYYRRRAVDTAISLEACKPKPIDTLMEEEP
jgi:hypothetical protein